MLARDQFGEETLLLLVTAVSTDLIDAEIGVRAVAQSHRRRRAAYLFDGNDMFEIAEPCSAIFFLGRDAVQAQVAHSRPQLPWETIGLVDLGGDRRHLL